jgi:ribonuclease HII
MIVSHSADYSIGIADHKEIDRFNIYNATMLAMHRAVDGLKCRPEYLIVDGNRFKPYGNIPFCCLVKGDARYMSIAAASILAKTFRDELMTSLNLEFPGYGWDRNSGYPTRFHREAILQIGISPVHRKTYRLLDKQMKIFTG